MGLTQDSILDSGPDLAINLDEYMAMDSVPDLIVHLFMDSAPDLSSNSIIDLVTRPVAFIHIHV